MLQSSAVTTFVVEPAVETAPVVLVPAYKPGLELISLCDELCTSPEFGGVVVVDDGSGEQYAPIFSELRTITGVSVLEHVTNLGKGAALKTGLNYIACKFRHSVGVITADADGQHAPEDILNIGEALSKSPSKLILGGRLFHGDVPMRSRLGNGVTKLVMRALIGCRLSDTQTGLRGIPMQFVPELLRSTATKYDFELDMLLKWQQKGGREFLEIPIRTIYIDGNHASHFNPFTDSVRVYLVFLRFFFSFVIQRSLMITGGQCEECLD